MHFADDALLPENQDQLIINVAPTERFTSVAQVEQVVRIARAVGRDVATAEDARRILKIGTWYHSVEGTLANLGMAPNRKPGQRGFLVGQTEAGVPQLSDAKAPAYA